MKQLKLNGSILLIAGILFSGLQSSVFANGDIGNFRFEYWAMGANGEATVKGASANLKDDHKLFNGSANGLVIGGDRLFEDWGLNMDFFWGSRTGRNQISASQSVDWDTEYLILTAGAFKRFMDNDAASGEGNFKFDGLAGIRPFSGNYSLEFDPITPSNTNNNGTEYVNMVDLYAGLRLRATLNPKWAFELYGDAGGFDITSGSQFNSLCKGSMVWMPNESLSVLAGYRYYRLKTDNQEGARQTDVDLEITGPTIGIELKF